ncbi:MAG: oligosaccharide flippase family protein, partial [Aeriscardovia sp.]|nr:oligosaccharide flippase family protein [Aeriscardovia sp.]
MASVKRNLFYNVLLNVSKVIFPLITAPYVTRVLDADDLGLANFANTYAGYFALVAVLGVPFYGLREIAKVRDNKQQTNRLFNELFSIAIINTIFICTIYIISIFLIGQLRSDYIVFLITGIVLYCSPFTIDWLYGGLENYKIITIRSLIIKILSISSLFLFVRDKNDFIVFL